jgi:acid-sensing ion channel, other
LEVKKDDKIDLRKSFVRTLRYEEIKSDSDVRKIEIKGRRCLFTDESNGNYYQNYTKNLCKMSCRIQNALNKCGCVPYFYPLIKEKKCNLNGMICLSNTNWTDVSSCKCLEMCDSVIFTSLENKIAKDNFDPKVEFKIILPQTIYKRSVLFDFADLIGKNYFKFSKIKIRDFNVIYSVGLGGSLALFLGFSFLSAAEIFYFILEYILEIIIEVIIPRLVGIFKRF